nr:hypothetical protein Iba_chr10fCG5570 [Ipomoea batatas]
MEDEVEDLLTCKTAEPCALRFPSKGSTRAASSGSISTLNLLCASYIWKQGESPSAIMATPDRLLRRFKDRDLGAGGRTPFNSRV